MDMDRSRACARETDTCTGAGRSGTNRQTAAVATIQHRHSTETRQAQHMHMTHTHAACDLAVSLHMATCAASLTPVCPSLGRYTHHKQTHEQGGSRSSSSTHAASHHACSIACLDHSRHHAGTWHLNWGCMCTCQASHVCVCMREISCDAFSWLGPPPHPSPSYLP